MAASPTIDPLQLYIAGITPSLRLLMVFTVWAAALIPLLILLFFLSTPTVRKQPIFAMNVFTVTMGIIIGIMNMELYVTQILNPLDPMSMRTLLAYIGMILIMPILMDCILAYRLTAVYPRRTTSTLLLAIIFVPIVAFKIARLTNLIIFMVTFARDILQKGTGGSAIPDFQKLWDHAPYTKIEWIFQVVDNCYTSSLFLWQLWVGRSREKQSGRVDSFAYIFVTNLYFEIICVLLATIWAVKTHAEVEGRQNHTYPSVSSMSYRSGETREIVITRDIDITTSASVELNDLSKEQWRHK